MGFSRQFMNYMIIKPRTIIGIIVLCVASYATYSPYLLKRAQAPFMGRVITTQEFSQNSALLKRAIDFCKNNPGELNSEPNCVNAESAMLLSIRGTGKGDFPSLNSHQNSNK